MRKWQEGDGWHIDVRGMAPPQPLVEILRLLGSVHDATPVTAHLDRDPVMLYPELARIGWQGERIDAPGDEFRLLLRRLP